MIDAGTDKTNSPPPTAWGLRTIRSGTAAIVARLADTLFPPVCLACREPVGSHDALCPGCWTRIEFIRPPICDRLGMPMPFSTGERMVSAAAVADPPDYDRARAVARYDGTVRRLVHDLKFRDRQDSRRLLAQWMTIAGKDLLEEAQLIVPVPLGRWRLISRRFNQAAMLGEEVARLAAKDFEPLALVRTRHTRSQVGLTRSERRENVRGAFAVPAALQPRIAGRGVLLVDDIVTTGATVGAAARALKRAKAARVDVLAVAMVTDVALVPG
jgi:ComF family protein